MATENTIDITFEGKTRELKLTLGEIERLEDAFDLPLDEINLNRMKAIVLLVAFAMSREQPRRPLNDIIDEIHAKGIESIIDETEETAPKAKARPTKRAAA